MSIINIEKNRKLHDLWALILMTVVFLAVIALSIMLANTGPSVVIPSESTEAHTQAGATAQAPENISEAHDNNLPKPRFTIKLLELGVAALTLFTIFVLCTPLIFFCVKKAAKFLIYTSFILPPVGTVCLWLLTGCNPYGLVGVVISLLFSILLYYFTKDYLDFATAVFTKAAEILSSYSFTLIFINTLSLALQMVHIAFIFYFIGSNDTSKTIYSILCIFHIVTIEFFVNYATQVFVSSLTVFTLGGRKKGILGDSIHIVIYASGSIAMGAQLLALIVVMEYMVSKSSGQRASNRARDSSSNTLAGAICLCIVGLLLNVLHVLVEQANRLAFPYIAQYGHGYIDSMSKAYHKLQESSGKFPIALGLLPRFCAIFAFLAFGIFSLLSLLGVYLVISLMGSNIRTSFVALLFTLILSVVMASRLYDMFDAASLSIIYTDVFNHELYPKGAQNKTLLLPEWSYSSLKA